MMDNFFPALLLTYLHWLSQGISKPNRLYLRNFIWALLIVEGRKCITRISESCFFVDKSLSSFERFLADNQWDISYLLSLLVKLLIKELDQALKVYGQYLVALDTILIGKASKKMIGVQKFKDHSSDPKRGGYQIAHQWAVGALLSHYKDEILNRERFLAWPIVNRLVSGQKNPMLFINSKDGNAQANFWNTAVATVLQMKSYLGYLNLNAPFRVVVDAYFANVSFIQPMVDEIIGVISRLRKDAVAWDDPSPYKGKGRPAKRGKKWNLKELIEAFPAEAVEVCLYGKVRVVECVVREVWLRNLSQKVRVVVIKGIVEPVILLSTDLSLSAKAIIEIYGARFSLEIALRDLKGHLGYSDYQSPTTLAFYRFVHLCCIAFCLWRLMLLPKNQVSWLEPTVLKSVDESTFSFAKARRGLRRFVIKELLSSFSKSAPGADLRKVEPEIEPLLQIAA
jgi:hypothetical protein